MCACLPSRWRCTGGGAGPSSAAAHPAVAVDVAAEDDVLNVQSLVGCQGTRPACVLTPCALPNR